MTPPALPLLAVLLLSPGAAETPLPLERELLRVAKELVKEFQQRGYANVGVLKFGVSKDGKNLTERAGTLNLLLARRLEVALVLANDPRKPLGILNNATAVAHQLKGANHLTREGRQRLFTANYPLAWGDQKVAPDAFVTGLALVGPDLKTLTISLLAFDRQHPNLAPLLEDFTVRTSPEQLVELGESYNARVEDGRIVPVDAGWREEMPVRLAAQVRRGKEKHPAADPQAPVTLEVRYDGKAVPFQVREGKAFVPEPREGQKVELVLKRDSSRQRYGVVLKVNGENAIGRQRLPDLNCRRWILEPGDGPLTIHGYQVNDRETAAFRVLTPAEWKQREADYGADVGTITLTVFGELKGRLDRPDPLDPADEAREVTVVFKGTLETQPEKGEPEKPPSLGALKARLLADANRGLIVGGARDVGDVRRVRFTADPLPVMVLTVFCFRPEDGPKK